MWRWNEDRVEDQDAKNACLHTFEFYLEQSKVSTNAMTKNEQSTDERRGDREVTGKIYVLEMVDESSNEREG